jgi:hypothetical protein
MSVKFRETEAEVLRDTLLSCSEIFSHVSQQHFLWAQRGGHLHLYLTATPSQGLLLEFVVADGKW